MKTRIFPQPLRPGDRVAVIAPAGKISPQVVEPAIRLLEEAGFRVIRGKHLYDDYHIFAGTDQDRAADLQEALDDSSIRALFFARGGYGSMRTFLNTRWDNFFRDPKWLIGFSDITLFHAVATTHHVVSLHAAMSAYFQTDGVPGESFHSLLRVLKGEKPEYHLPSHPLNRTGTATGTLTGGNLTLLMSMRKTPVEVDWKDKIVFIEDIGEYDYHIDRMMMSLDYSGDLSKPAGLVVGYFTGTKTLEAPLGMNSEEIIRSVAERYDFPILFGFPAGHELPCMPLLMGARVRMKVGDAGADLIFEE